KTGNDAPPVIIAGLPAGPLQGPAHVRIDLSGSYDPDGSSITMYSISFGGIPDDIVSPDPVQDIILQPGCYHITAYGTSNGLSGSTDAYLKVYPQWQDDPAVVVSGPASIPRSLSMQAVDNQDGSATLVFYDVLQPGLTAVTDHTDGSRSWDFLPLPGSSSGV